MIIHRALDTGGAHVVIIAARPSLDRVQAQPVSEMSDQHEFVRSWYIGPQPDQFTVPLDGIDGIPKPREILMKNGTRKSGFRIGAIACFALCSMLRPAGLNVAAADELESNVGGPAKIENELVDPVRLEADGEPIDIGKLSKVAHAGPWIADVDADGDRDLLVGDFPGFFWFFENTGSESKPEYTSRGKLQAGGIAAKTPVY